MNDTYTRGIEYHVSKDLGGFHFAEFTEENGAIRVDAEMLKEFVKECVDFLKKNPERLSTFISSGDTRVYVCRNLVYDKSKDKYVDGFTVDICRGHVEFDLFS